MQESETVKLARSIRAHSLRMVYQVRASHIGSSLSAVDILAVLHGAIMHHDPTRPDCPERDRFIMSKGHAAAAYYAALAECGYFPLEWLDSYCQDGSVLSGHVTRCGVPGVELSTGSLGHGLPVACGMAIAGKRENHDYRVFALLSDGECDEGSVWEAALFAGHHHLSNLIAIIDYNKIQSFGSVREVLDLEPFVDKWKAFRWLVREIDGHDHDQLKKTLSDAGKHGDLPLVIIAHTVKGKGVSFMENSLQWHYKSPSAEQLEQSLLELEVIR